MNPLTDLSHFPMKTKRLTVAQATIAYLNKMSDEELQLKLDAAIDRCTSQVFRNMRSHAG